MDTITVIRKLREIENLLGSEEHSFLRGLIHEAREYTIQVQRESAEQGRRESRSSFPVF